MAGASVEVDVPAKSRADGPSNVTGGGHARTPFVVHMVLIATAPNSPPQLATARDSGISHGFVRRPVGSKCTFDSVNSQQLLYLAVAWLSV